MFLKKIKYNKDIAIFDILGKKIFTSSRTPSLLKSYLLKQNNNNENSPQASPRPTPKPSLDSTTTALEAVKNGKVDGPEPAQPQSLAQPSPGLAQVSTPKPKCGRVCMARRHHSSIYVSICLGKGELQRFVHGFYSPCRTQGQLQRGYD